MARGGRHVFQGLVQIPLLPLENGQTIPGIRVIRAFGEDLPVAGLGLGEPRFPMVLYSESHDFGDIDLRSDHRRITAEGLPIHNLNCLLMPMRFLPPHNVPPT